MRIVWIAGARPNFIKIAPIWRAMEKHNHSVPDRSDLFEPLLVHTGQHYDTNMSGVFFRDLVLPNPHIFLGVGSGSHGEQLAKVLIAFENVLEEVRPDIVGVVGDVNSTVACALATTKGYVLPGRRTPKLVHVEAGLRSRDRSMPEEINRMVTDILSDVLFTTEEDAHINLLREGVAKEKIHFVGNVMVDSLFWALSRHDAQRGPSILAPSCRWPPDSGYILITFHRPSNVDDPAMLRRIMLALRYLAKSCPVIFPIHPRTVSRLREVDISMEISTDLDLTVVGLHFLPPLGYLDFLLLLSKASVVITDSGGIQEETTALGVPCLTFRENTERPITVSVGTNILVGTQTERLVSETESVLKGRVKKGTIPPLWDGHAAERIVSVLGNQKQD